MLVWLVGRWDGFLEYFDRPSVWLSACLPLSMSLGMFVRLFIVSGEVMVCMDVLIRLNVKVYSD